MTTELIPDTNVVLMTGFEAGAISLPGTGGGSVEAGTVGAGGAQRLRLTSTFREFPFTAIADMYCAFWIVPGSATTFTFTAAGVASLVTRTAAGLWSSTYAAGGTVATEGAQHVQIYYKRDAVNGRLALKVDGLDIIDFTGNTGTGNIAVLRWSVGGSGNSMLFDHLIVRSDTWPGDVRIAPGIPNSDEVAQWTPSTGSDNFATVAAIPASAAYVESGTNGQSDLYGIAPVTLTARTVVAVSQVTRANKTTADTQQIKLQVKSGTATDQTAALDLLTSSTFKTRIFETDPDTTDPWLAAGVNALQIGQESVIP
jgi:hypothetical protein